MYRIKDSSELKKSKDLKDLNFLKLGRFKRLWLIWAVLLMAILGNQSGAAGAVIFNNQNDAVPLSHRQVVQTIAELQSTILAAQPGDTILLAAGAYLLDQDIEVRCKGRSGAPIVIGGISSGKVILTGKGGISLKAPAAYIELRDFVFRHESSQARSGVGTHHCRWTHNVFETTGNGDDLTIAGDQQEIDHNSFQNKDAMGRFLAIRGHEKQIAVDLWIHHNYFAHFKDQGGGNGAEAFQFGLSGFSMSTSNSLVEHNLFEDCHGESELISVKASGVTIRYNTIRDSKAQFTLRHGNHNTVYGNFFFHTPGIRFFGDDHMIYSNYFQNCSQAIQIGNGDGEVAAGDKLTCHDRPDRVFVGFNTLVQNTVGILFKARKDGLGAHDIQLTGNLILGGQLAKIEKQGGVLKGCSLTDNVYHGTSDNANLAFKDANEEEEIAASGNRMEDPKLVLRKIAQGGATTATYHLSKQSPDLIFAGSLPASFNKRSILDIDGQARKGKLNIGADQSSMAPVINYPLNAPEPGAVGIESAGF